MHRCFRRAHEVRISFHVHVQYYCSVLVPRGASVAELIERVAPVVATQASTAVALVINSESVSIVASRGRDVIQSHCLDMIKMVRFSCPCCVPSALCALCVHLFTPRSPHAPPSPAATRRGMRWSSPPPLCSPTSTATCLPSTPLAPPSSASVLRRRPPSQGRGAAPPPTKDTSTRACLRCATRGFP